MIRCPCAAFFSTCCAHRPHLFSGLAGAHSAHVFSAPSSSFGSPACGARSRPPGGRRAVCPPGCPVPASSGVVRRDPGASRKKCGTPCGTRQAPLSFSIPCAAQQTEAAATWGGLANRSGRLTRSADWSMGCSPVLPPAWMQAGDMLAASRGAAARELPRKRRRARRSALDQVRAGDCSLGRSVRSCPARVCAVRLVPVQVVGRKEGMRLGGMDGSLALCAICRLSAAVVSVAASLGHVSYEGGRQHVFEPPRSGPLFELLCR